MAIESTVSLRYSDLDPYNHVTSSRYLEFVEAALFSPNDQTREVRQKIEKMCQKQIHLSYRRAIALVPVIRVRAEPELAENGAHVKFQILGATGDVVHSEGVVEYALDTNLIPSAGVEGPIAFPEKGNPRIFRWNVVNRFDDLSCRNEMPLSKHVDLVVASRWLFLQHSEGVSAEDIIKKGWAFFLTEALVDSHVPIRGVQTVECRSWLAKIERAGAEVVIRFQILSEDGAQVFSSGKFTFAVMDFSKGLPRRAPMPDWIEPVFFEKRT